MEQDSSDLQFCKVQFKQLLQNSHQCQIKIVGIIKSVFSTKKYIIEVYLNNQIVIRTIRKYNQFEATYEVIKMKFRNFDVGQFPSKYQVFGKQQTRKQYFEALLNKVVDNYNRNPQNQASKRLFSIIYLFMTRSLANQQKISNDLNKSSQTLQTFQKKRKLSFNNFETSYTQEGNLQRSNLNSSQKKVDKQSQYQLQRNKTRRNSQGSFIEINSFKQLKKPDQSHPVRSQNKKSCYNTSQRTIQVSNRKKQCKEFYFEIQFQDEQEWKTRYLKIQNSSLLIFKDEMENNFRTKIELYRIQVQFYHRAKNIFDNFCQKMEINNQPTFTEDKSIITISHDYDYKKLLIRGLSPTQRQDQTVQDLQVLKSFQQKQQNKLNKLKQSLQEASQISPINQKFQGVFNPIGKIFLVIHKLILKNVTLNQKDILKIKIKTTNLQYQCKKVLLKQQNTIKQGFFIPISNTFQTIYIQAIASRQEGWIRQQFKDFQIGGCAVQFSQLLTKPEGQKIQKINVVLQRSISASQQFYNCQAFLQYSIQNYSQFSSIFSESFANQNDGKIISGLKLQDIDHLSITLDRALRVIGNIALFVVNLWRNVYLFKYPRLGKTFFTILLILNVFADIKTFITIGFGVIIFAMLYNHPFINEPLKILFNYLFFSQIHPNFIQPLCLGTTQIKYRKWCQALQEIANQYQLSKDNKIQKRQNLHKKSLIEFNFQVHKKTFRVTQQVKGILGKVFEGKKIVQIISRMISGAVNFIEKLCNLFLWVDLKRTLLILFLLTIFSGVASDFLIRIIAIIFCTHRLYKGMNFYAFKHYERNRKIAVYTLRYILNKNFSLIINEPSTKFTGKRNNKNYISNTKIQELDPFISNIQFPLTDDSATTKLKNQLQKLICVYLDIQELQQQQIRKFQQRLNQNQKQQQIANINQKEQKIRKKSGSQTSKDYKISIRLGQIISIIQSCETRLSLDWVAGKQGLSNQYQELRQLTKQPPLIDVWLEHALINFVLNVPSQLFIKLKKYQKVKQN